jgi:hypothetical protein
MANKWLAHVKKTMKLHKGMKFSAILKAAKKSYKKHGGAEPETPDAPTSDETPETPVTGLEVAGGRRRRKTRRHSRRR